MTDCIGQSVQKIKPNMSRDVQVALGHAVQMGDEPDSEWVEGFKQRLKEVRGDRSQKDMADLLDVSESAYAKWENRGSAPPLHVLPKIWKIGAKSPEWLLEGKPMKKAAFDITSDALQEPQKRPLARKTTKRA